MTEYWNWFWDLVSTTCVDFDKHKQQPKYVLNNNDVFELKHTFLARFSDFYMNGPDLSVTLIVGWFLMDNAACRSFRPVVAPASRLKEVKFKISLFQMFA